MDPVVKNRRLDSEPRRLGAETGRVYNSAYTENRLDSEPRRLGTETGRVYSSAYTENRLDSEPVTFNTTGDPLVDEAGLRGEGVYHLASIFAWAVFAGAQHWTDYARDDRGGMSCSEHRRLEDLSTAREVWHA